MTILNLLVNLDQSFKKYLKDYSDQKPSLSFGVSITYYKSPLYESLKEAANRLFSVAKKYPDPEQSTKNALAIRIEKNSGQSFELTTDIKSKSLAKLKEILNVPKQMDQVDLSGIAYDLIVKKSVLLATDGETTAIDAFFENHFDEFIHKMTGRAFLDKVKDLLKISIQETDTLEKAINQTFSLLRFYHFFTSTELK